MWHIVSSQNRGSYTANQRQEQASQTFLAAECQLVCMRALREEQEDLPELDHSHPDDTRLNTTLSHVTNNAPNKFEIGWMNCYR